MKFHGPRASFIGREEESPVLYDRPAYVPPELGFVSRADHKGPDFFFASYEGRRGGPWNFIRSRCGSTAAERKETFRHPVRIQPY